MLSQIAFSNPVQPSNEPIERGVDINSSSMSENVSMDIGRRTPHMAKTTTTPPPSQVMMPNGRTLVEMQEVEAYIQATREKEMEHSIILSTIVQLKKTPQLQ